MSHADSVLGDEHPHETPIMSHADSVLGDEHPHEEEQKAILLERDCNALKNALAYQKGLDEPLLAYVLKELLSLMIDDGTHCDVKLEDVYVDGQGDLVLANSNSVSPSKNGCLWNFGMIGLQLAHGMAPFAVYEPMELLRMTIKNHYCLDYKNTFSKSLRSLLATLLLGEETTTAEIARHSFFQMACSQEVFHTEIGKKLSAHKKPKAEENITFAHGCSKEEISQARFEKAMRNWSSFKEGKKKLLIPECLDIFSQSSDSLFWLTQEEQKAITLERDCNALKNALAYQKGLDEPLLAYVLKELLSLMIDDGTHCDVKLEDVYVDGQGDLVLANSNSVSPSKNGCLWNFGMIGLQLAHGMAPFAVYEPMELLRMTIKNHYCLDYKNTFSKSLRSLLATLLLGEETTTAEIARHSFFQMACSQEVFHTEIGKKLSAHKKPKAEENITFAHGCSKEEISQARFEKAMRNWSSFKEGKKKLLIPECLDIFSQSSDSLFWLTQEEQKAITLERDCNALKNALAYQKGLDEPLLAYVLKELLSLMIDDGTHCDVKLEDVYVDGQGDLVLANSNSVSPSKNGCLWNFGMIGLQLAHGMAPFAVYEPMELLRMTIKNHYCLDYKNTFSKSLRSLLATLLLGEETTTAEIARHSFFQMACSQEVFHTEIGKKLSAHKKPKAEENITFAHGCSKEEISQARFEKAMRNWSSFKEGKKKLLIPECLDIFSQSSDSLFWLTQEEQKAITLERDCNALKNALAYQKGLDEPLLAYVLKELLSLMIDDGTHCDVKLEDVYVDGQGDLVLANSNSVSPSKNGCLWNFGMIGLQLAHGMAPFAVYEPMELLRMTIKNHYCLDYKNTFSKSLRSLLATLLLGEETTTAEIARHSFFQMACSQEVFHTEIGKKLSAHKKPKAEENITFAHGCSKEEISQARFEKAMRNWSSFKEGKKKLLIPECLDIFSQSSDSLFWLTQEEQKAITLERDCNALKNALAYQKGLDEPLLAYVLKELLSLMIDDGTHCDVKLEDVYVDGQGDLVLANSNSVSPSKNGCLWNFGMIGLQLAHGMAPFAVYEPMELLRMTIKNHYCLDYKNTFSKSLRSLLATLLLGEETTTAEIARHSFFQMACSQEVFHTEIGKKLSAHKKPKAEENITFAHGCSKEEISQARFEKAMRNWSSFKEGKKKLLIPECLDIFSQSSD